MSSWPSMPLLLSWPCGLKVCTDFLGAQENSLAFSMEPYGCTMLLCVMLGPVFLCGHINIYVALLGICKNAICIILLAPDMLPRPRQWCSLNGCPCGLDEVKVFCKRVAVPRLETLVKHALAITGNCDGSSHKILVHREFSSKPCCL